MSKQKTKIAIIGAGFVGAATAYTIAAYQLVQEIVLIDIDQDKARGEAMDISHGLCHLGDMDIHQGEYADCRDSDVIIITGGLGRKPGESRLDLANKNIPIAREMTEHIMKFYTTGVILIISNPVDILTYLVAKWSGLPAGRVIGSGTSLDSARFRHHLSKQLNVDVQSVHGYIVGEHGDAQIPVWSAARIAGLRVEDYCAAIGITLDDKLKKAWADEVRDSGAQVIRAKRATYYAIAAVTSSIVRSFLRDQNTARTVSTVIHGEYGISDVALSLPSIVNAQGVQRIIPVEFTTYEQEQLLSCAQKMRDFLNEVQY